MSISTAQYKRLKVLFLAAWYPSKENPVNGIFIREHARAVYLYNDVTVIAFSTWSKSLKRLFFNVNENIEDGIRTIRVRNKILPVNKINSFVNLWSIFSCFRMLLNEGWRPDIMHANVFTVGVPAVILGKIYGIPVVITEHYTNIATHSLNPIELKQLKFSMKRAKVILPVSHDLRGAIENYYGINNRFKIVPNTVNIDSFHPLRNQNSNEIPGKKKMLLVGIPTPRKGIPYLLEVLSKIRARRQDFHLNIVGEGPNRHEYEELTAKLGLQSMITFHGRQPEIVSFMRECDFFVLPSLYENFGVVYIEAMACGKPVIATNAGGPKEIVNDEVGILVPPKDVKALEKAIEYMLDNYKNYSSEKIAQYAKERFSHRTVGQMIDTVYREVLQK